MGRLDPNDLTDYPPKAFIIIFTKMRIQEVVTPLPITLFPLIKGDSHKATLKYHTHIHIYHLIVKLINNLVYQDQFLIYQLFLLIYS